MKRILSTSGSALLCIAALMAGCSGADDTASPRSPSSGTGGSSGSGAEYGSGGAAGFDSSGGDTGSGGTTSSSPCQKKSDCKLPECAKKTFCKNLLSDGGIGGSAGEGGAAGSGSSAGTGGLPNPGIDGGPIAIDSGIGLVNVNASISTAKTDSCVNGLDISQTTLTVDVDNKKPSAQTLILSGEVKLESGSSSQTWPMFLTQTQITVKANWSKSVLLETTGLPTPDSCSYCDQDATVSLTYEREDKTKKTVSFGPYKIKCN